MHTLATWSIAKLFERRADERTFVGKNGVEQAPNVFDHDDLRSDLVVNSDRFREKHSLVFFSELLTGFRKRGAR